MITLDLGTGREWMAKAACRGHDPDAWFPTVGKPSGEAVAICTGCPVREQCADYADAHGERHGLWGGLTTDERYRRARRRQLEAS